MTIIIFKSQESNHFFFFISFAFFSSFRFPLKLIPFSSPFPSILPSLFIPPFLSAPSPFLSSCHSSVPLTSNHGFHIFPPFVAPLLHTSNACTHSYTSSMLPPLSCFSCLPPTAAGRERRTSDPCRNPLSSP